ncbi:MAG: class I SAM-dependent methyltransferase [Planctomycetota bacterium]
MSRAGLSSDDAVRSIHRNWDARVPVHLRSEMYRSKIEALRAGESPLDRPVRDELGDVNGVRVLHLQCHIGTDSLALARRGAIVTGLDISEPAVEAARSLAGELEIGAEFVVGDAHQADAVLAGRAFDLVFATEGVMCWIADLERWMASAAALLDTGGMVYVVDDHPFTHLLEEGEEDGTLELVGDYFRAGAWEDPAGPTYADDGSGAVMPETVDFQHTMGSIVSTVAGTGLVVESVREWPFTFWRGYRCLEYREGAWWLPKEMPYRVPLAFSIRARKAGTGVR